MRWRTTTPVVEKVDVADDPVICGKKSARPVIKAAGGKTRLLPEILPRLPKEISRYHEPFVGGGAVFFALAAAGRLVDAEIHLADMNAELVNLYEVIRDWPTKLVKKLRGDADFVNESDAFYRVRAWDPKELSPTARAARMLYLNKTTFNGLYRVNKKGQFNAPFGRYDAPTICDEANILAVSEVLQDANIHHVDFEEVCKGAKSGDVTYCDPPYLPLSTTSNFTSYTSDGFSLGDHERLRDAMLDMGRRGVIALLSNCAAPAIRDLYSGKRFKVEEVEAPRAINSDASKRGNVKELLITVRRSL